MDNRSILSSVDEHSSSPELCCAGCLYPVVNLDEALAVPLEEPWHFYTLHKSMGCAVFFLWRHALGEGWENILSSPTLWELQRVELTAEIVPVDNAGLAALRLPEVN